jgi:hypothetical protein
MSTLLSTLIIFILALVFFIGMIACLFIIFRDRYLKRIMDLELEKGMFQKKSSFMNSTERWFFKLLRKYLALPDYEIFVQVHLAALIEVSEKAINYYQTFEDLDKYIDFVIAESETMKPVLAIELNGSDHDRDTRKIRDLFLKRIFKECFISFLPIDVEELNNEEKLKQKILGELNKASIKTL